MVLCNTIIIIITWPVGSHCRPVMALCNTIIIIITWPVAGL